MIYFSNYWDTKSHIGQLYSISLTLPKGFQVHGHLDFFKPTQELEDWWHFDQLDWAEYTLRYRALLNSRKEEILDWIATLDKFGNKTAQPCMTLLSWERKPERSHRSIIQKFVLDRHAPMFNGGEGQSPIQVGDEIDWVFCPDYLFPYVGKTLKVKSVTPQGLGKGYVRCALIDKNIPLHLVRPAEKR